MSNNVDYVGNQRSYSIYASRWADAGTTGGTFTWNADNNFSHPASDFTSDQLAYLTSQPIFRVGNDVGAKGDTGSTGATGPAVTPVTASTAALTAIGNAINTTGKVLGKGVWNTDTHAQVYASGTTAGAHWYDAVGADTHTPV